MRATWAVACLMALAIAAALWTAQPFRELPDVVPSEGEGAARSGLAIAAFALVLLGGAATGLIWAVRRDLDHAILLLVRSAIAFGLLLVLARLVLASPASVPTELAWTAAAVLAVLLAWFLRDGWRAQVAAAVAAGGFAGMAAGVGGLAVLAIVTGIIAAYDAWAVRRASMGQAAAASDAVAAPLTVGSAVDGLSLGLGDLLLPAALVAAAAGLGPFPAVGAAVGLAIGLALLAAAVRTGDVPGIPYLGGGALAGAAAGLLAQPLVS